jgi:plastocyanin
MSKRAHIAGVSLRGRDVVAVALLSAAAVLSPTIASATSPTVEAVNEGGGLYGEHHRWSPTQVSVAAGGVVSVSNPTAVDHGVNWVGGPETPACSSGVPVGTTPAASGSKWSGTCKFTKPGLYTFYCTVHGAEMTGNVTVPGTPVATTEQPAEVTQTGAMLNGTVKPEGNATSYYFEYGTTSLEQRTSEQSVGSDFTAHHVSAGLKGLLPDTTYHVELVAVYGTNTTVHGGEEAFTTSSVAAPHVTTGQASAVTETGATLNGIVSPEGLVTSYFFAYGLTTSSEHTTPLQQTGPEGSNQAAFAAITGLLPGTVYHFQLIAENSSDASAPIEGAEHTFTTASPPPPPPPPPPPSPPPASSSTTTPTAPSPTTTPVPTAAAPKSEEGPALGSPIKLISSQHGSSVRGVVDVSQFGAGGRLEVALLAGSASLAKVGGLSKVRVGRFLRSSLQAGAVAFAVPLTAKGKSALRRHRRLALTVQIVLTPIHGAATSVTRSVVLHA